METPPHPERSDFVGPTGNATDKYGSRNPVTRKLLERFLGEIDTAMDALGPASILDVGCGEGVVTERLARRTRAAVVGVDLDDEHLVAEWHRRMSGTLSFRPGSAYELPFGDASFDCVCALEVLEHLERPHDALDEITRVARSAFVVSVPREPLWRISHLLAGRDVRAIGNTPGHVNHWSARSFERLVSGYGGIVRVRKPFPWTIVVAEPARAR